MKLTADNPESWALLTQALNQSRVEAQKRADRIASWKAERSIQANSARDISQDSDEKIVDRTVTRLLEP